MQRGLKAVEQTLGWRCYMEIVVSQRPLKTELTGSGEREKKKKKVEQAEEYLFRYGCLAVLLILFIYFVPPCSYFHAKRVSSGLNQMTE